MWNEKTVSVILMTYAERDSIRAVIEDFFATGVVDEVLVVNNNAQAGTSEEVAKTAAREVVETKQGYGNAIRRGLSDATGDLIVLAEPDGTFLGRDIVKLLAYSEECDVVLGTRTTNELIWDGANMGTFLKWGNWAVAKMVEVQGPGLLPTAALRVGRRSFRIGQVQDHDRRSPRPATGAAGQNQNLGQ